MIYWHNPLSLGVHECFSRLPTPAEIPMEWSFSCLQWSPLNNCEPSPVSSLHFPSHFFHLPNKPPALESSPWGCFSGAYTNTVIPSFELERPPSPVTDLNHILGTEFPAWHWVHRDQGPADSLRPLRLCLLGLAPQPLTSKFLIFLPSDLCQPFAKASLSPMAMPVFPLVTLSRS